MGKRINKFIAIADIHLEHKLFNSPDLMQDMRDNLVRAIDLAISLKVDCVVVVGDLYDSNKPTPDTVKFVFEQVARARANGIVVAGIAGDHDKPMNNAAWIHLSGMIPINDIDPGRFIGFDYSDNSQENVIKITELENKNKVEWIFLHGQVPQLFQWCEDKKRLDFTNVDLINDFPNLKGIILGDIHKPIEGTIPDPKQERTPEPYIGYCGSLSIVKIDEIGTKTGILYFDGEKLSRVKLEYGRPFIRFNLAESLSPINWVERYTSFFRENKKKKPVFYVDVGKEDKDLIPLLGPLYEVGIVKVATTKVKQGKGNKDETINIRSELTTNERIEEALKACNLDGDAFVLAYKTLTEVNPKTILDEYKQKILEHHDNEKTTN